MNRAEELRAEIISYLLSEYPVKSKAQYLEQVVRDYLLRECNADYVDKFWSEQGVLLRDEFIQETNRRLDTGASLRFNILYDSGDSLCGADTSGSLDSRTVFQDARQDLDPLQFERLAGVLLEWAGCHSVWLTPQSHDQGLDAFGYSRFFGIDSDWPCGKPDVVFLAQAKHYVKNRVSSYDMREFVGASECAKHKVYAVQGEKYDELEIRPFAPVALLYITSGELKTTAKIHALKSGVIVITSDDLFELCEYYWKEQGLTILKTKRSYLARLKKEGHVLPVSR